MAVMAAVEEEVLTQLRNSVGLCIIISQAWVTQAHKEAWIYSPRGVACVSRVNASSLTRAGSGEEIRGGGGQEEGMVARACVGTTTAPFRFESFRFIF
jgi:hypothetical protein